MTSTSRKKFLYPPGGILIWLIIFIEVMTFCAGIIVYVWQRNISPEDFEQSQNSLNTEIGLINTFLLLISGYFVAEALRYIKSGRTDKSQSWFWIAIIFGAGFLMLKGVEYYDKLHHGYHLTYNTFFTFYWLLTGFHFLHVLFGVCILMVLTLKLRRGIYHSAHYFDLETGGAFWHMCDVIWLLLFPMLYLL